MPKTSEPPMVKKTLRLYLGDFEAIGALYPDITANLAIRLLIRQHIRKAETAEANSIGETHVPEDINLD